MTLTDLSSQVDRLTDSIQAKTVSALPAAALKSIRYVVYGAITISFLKALHDAYVSLQAKNWVAPIALAVGHVVVAVLMGILVALFLNFFFAPLAWAASSILLRADEDRYRRFRLPIGSALLLAITVPIIAVESTHNLPNLPIALQVLIFLLFFPSAPTFSAEVFVLPVSLLIMLLPRSLHDGLGDDGELKVTAVTAGAVGGFLFSLALSPQTDISDGAGATVQTLGYFTIAVICVFIFPKLIESFKKVLI